MRKLLVLGIVLLTLTPLSALDRDSFDEQIYAAIDRDDTSTVLRILEDLRLAEGTLLFDGDYNPAMVAFGQKKTQLGKAILKRYPELLNQEGRISRYQIRTPFAQAVALDDLDLCRWLVAQGADVHWVSFFRAPLFQSNILAYSPSEAMTEYLNTFHLPATYEIPQADSLAWTVNDNKVNLRASYDTKSAVLSQLNKGEEVFYLGNTTSPMTAGGREAYWIKVKTKAGVVGWVFGAFLTDPWVLEE